MDEIEKFANCIIEKYNFCTNTQTGFSCYIPDSNQYDNFGFIIWVYSKTHKRFETHFQNLFSSNRMNVIGQFNIGQSEYSNFMYDSVSKFISELDMIPGFHSIGNGINNIPSNRPRILNRAISFDFIRKDYEILKKLEFVFTNNSLIDYICTLKNNTNIPLKRINTTCYTKYFEK
jgi:hypothetical protein